MKKWMFLGLAALALLGGCTTYVDPDTGTAVTTVDPGVVPVVYGGDDEGSYFSPGYYDWAPGGYWGGGYWRGGGNRYYHGGGYGGYRGGNRAYVHGPNGAYRGPRGAAVVGPRGNAAVRGGGRGGFRR